jgi:hypothetical protein
MPEVPSPEEAMTVVALYPHIDPYGTEADQPLKVLRPDLSERIASVNTLRRVLTEIGLKVVEQDLIRNGNRPLLILERGDARLRGIAQWIRYEGGWLRAVIGNVEVRWPQ